MLDEFLWLNEFCMHVREQWQVCMHAPDAEDSPYAELSQRFACCLFRSVFSAASLGFGILWLADFLDSDCRTQSFYKFLSS